MPAHFEFLGVFGTWSYAYQVVDGIITSEAYESGGNEYGGGAVVDGYGRAGAEFHGSGDGVSLDVAASATLGFNEKTANTPYTWAGLVSFDFIASYKIVPDSGEHFNDVVTIQIDEQFYDPSENLDFGVSVGTVTPSGLEILESGEGVYSYVRYALIGDVVGVSARCSIGGSMVGPPGFMQDTIGVHATLGPVNLFAQLDGFTDEPAGTGIDYSVTLSAQILVPNEIKLRFIWADGPDLADQISIAKNVTFAGDDLATLPGTLDAQLLISDLGARPESATHLLIYVENPFAVGHETYLDDNLVAIEINEVFPELGEFGSTAGDEQLGNRVSVEYQLSSQQYWNDGFLLQFYADLDPIYSCVVSRETLRTDPRLSVVDQYGEPVAPEIAFGANSLGGTYRLLIDPQGTPLQAALEDHEVELLQVELFEPDGTPGTPPQVADFHGFYRATPSSQLIVRPGFGTEDLVEIDAGFILYSSTARGGSITTDATQILVITGAEDDTVLTDPAVTASVVAWLGAGDDYFRGGAGNDHAYGEQGRDTQFGEGGSDILEGGIGEDVLWGGAEVDSLIGGPDIDTLDGEVEAPPTDIAVFPASIAENNAPSTVVGTVIATDPNSADTFTFSLVAGGGSTNNDNFAIVGNQLQIKSTTDFETKSTYSVRIRVVDQSDLAFERQLTIGVTNVNEAPSVTPATFSIAENLGLNQSVGTVAATDPDSGDTATYSIVSGNLQGAFAINSTTGQITVANPLALNFEQTSTFSLVVQVLDGGGAIGTATVTVNLTNVNEAPVINNQTFGLSENASIGTVFGTVTATDPDAGQTLAYSITSGNTNGAFAISSTTGQLTVANAAALDFEATPAFILTVKVIDNGAPNLNTTAAVTINLTNVNEVPVIANQAFGVAENSPAGTVVGTVAAADLDAGQSLTYSITTGNTSGAFAINSTSGQLTVANAAALDFEATSIFTLTVKVIDNGAPNLNSTATITVTLTNVNEAPVIINQTFSVVENSSVGTTVGSVLATDPDAGQALTYAIVSGNTDGAFAINSTTGQLTVANASVLDLDTNPAFTLAVKVTDHGGVTLNSTATITVNVITANEVPVIADQAFALAENSVVGTTVGTVAATDPDAGQVLTYAIVSGNASGAFAINSTTGQLAVADAVVLNFESNPTFTLTVKVTDNGVPSLNSTATVAINLTNVNEAPAIGDQTFSVAENSAVGTVIGNIAATDPDAGQSLTYAIVSGNTGGAIAVNSATGQLTVANLAALDFETTPTITLTVKATDNSTPNLNSTATVTINLTNVNEAPVISNQILGLAENTPLGTVIGNVAASDPDASQSLTYSITSGNTGGTFAINSATGQITVANPVALNFEQNPTFSLVVQVTDGGSATGSGNVTVNLTNVNEAPSVTPATFSIAENLSLNQPVGTVTATDPDSGDTLTYSISGGNTSGAFAINPTTGAISVANPAALDYETTPSFALTVLVTDNHGATATATVTVNLVNVEESVQLNLVGGAVTWLANQSPVTVLPQLTVTGAGSLTGGMLSLSINAVGTSKKLLDQIRLPSFAGLGTSTGPQFANGHLTLQIQLNANATNAAVQSFLRGITFAAKGKGLKAPTRTVSVTLSAGGQSSSVSQTINVRKKA